MNLLAWFVLGATGALVIAGCSSGSAKADHGEITKPTEVSVFQLRPKDCVRPPKDVKAELSHVTVVPCTEDHPQEVFARVDYKVDNDPTDDPYPGDQALKTYADAHCQAGYEKYVGVPYSESKYFYTYLLPSARGWTDNKDRGIVCLLTTTGAQLTKSLQGSKE